MYEGLNLVKIANFDEFMEAGKALTRPWLPRVVFARENKATGKAILR